MKINVIVDGRIGVMNLTHSTFIVEDLKAHICNKIGLDVDSYKLKIDFNGDSIELVQTKSNPSFSSNQQKTDHKKPNDNYGTDSVPNFLMDDKSKETLENFRVFLGSIGSTFYLNETNNPNSTKSYTVNTGVTFFKKLSFTYRFYIFDKMGELIGVVNANSEAHKDSVCDRFGQPYKDYADSERVIHNALKGHLNHPLDVFHLSPNKQSIEIFFKNTRGTKPLYIKNIAKRIYKKHSGYDKQDIENICSVLVNPTKADFTRTAYMEKIEKIILAKVKQKFPKETDFVSVKPTGDGKLKILVYFKDDGWSRAIAYYGASESDYNNPLDPQLELRRSAVYKILRPYLGGN